MAGEEGSLLGVASAGTEVGGVLRKVGGEKRYRGGAHVTPPLQEASNTPKMGIMRIDWIRIECKSIRPTRRH